MNTKNAKDKSETVEALPMACADETAAVEFLEKQRWGDSPCCVHCGSVDVYQMTSSTGGRNHRYLWRCKDCKQQYTVRVGTVFEESRIPLRHWVYAFWRASTSKKGVAALEIKRQTGLSYKSALFMMHRVRWAMAPVNASDKAENGKLGGTVEADETYIGSTGRRIHNGNRPTASSERQVLMNYKERSPVFAALERGGRVRARVISTVNAETLTQALREHVEKSARLMTDEAPIYKRVGKEFSAHETVCHSVYEYVRGDVTTNTIESFFALLKRGIHGIYHNVSKEHLQRYLDQAEYLYNNRELEDGERVTKLIRDSRGKRLMSGYVIADDEV